VNRDRRALAAQGWPVAGCRSGGQAAEAAWAWTVVMLREAEDCPARAARLALRVRTMAQIPGIIGRTAVYMPGK
jgi:hypothetical protein